MTPQDIAKIESSLGIRLPCDYRNFILSQSLRGVFSDVEEAIVENERRRQMSWLGRPLDKSFYIFGFDKAGRELFLDLDCSESPVMVADHELRRGKLLAQTFADWISKSEVI